MTTIYHLSLREARQEFLRWYCIQTLLNCDGSTVKAAAHSGMSRDGFIHLLPKLGLRDIAKQIRDGAQLEDLQALTVFKLQEPFD